MPTFSEVDPWRGTGEHPLRGRDLHRLSIAVFQAAQDLDTDAFREAVAALEDAGLMDDAFTMWIGMCGVYVPPGVEIALEIAENEQATPAMNGHIRHLVECTISAAARGDLDAVAPLVQTALNAGVAVAVPFVLSLVRNARHLGKHVDPRHVWLWHMIAQSLRHGLFEYAEGLLVLFEAAYRRDMAAVREMIREMPIDHAVGTMHATIRIMAEYLDTSGDLMFVQLDAQGVPQGMLDPMGVDLSEPVGELTEGNAQVYVERGRARFTQLAHALAVNTPESLAKADALLEHEFPRSELSLMVFAGINALAGVVHEMEARGTRVIRTD